MSVQPAPPGVRLDKWLWAARLFKTRSLAVEDIDRGRVMVNDQAAKAARMLRPGDRITWRQSAGLVREFNVLALSDVRGPAPLAQTLYAETADSLAARARAAEQRRQGTEPAQSIADGRPTKRNRRQLADWQRWSASTDET